MPATATMPGPRTLKFIRTMEPYARKLPLHLWPAALHECGHLTVAIHHGLLPCSAKLSLDEAGWGHGSVCYRCDQRFPELSPRQQALISAAGAAAGAMLVDPGDSSALLSDVDERHIVEAGLKPDDPRLMREATEICRKHSRAMLRLVVMLARERELKRPQIAEALLTDPELLTLREPSGLVAIRTVNHAGM